MEPVESSVESSHLFFCLFLKKNCQGLKYGIFPSRTLDLDYDKCVITHVDCESESKDIFVTNTVDGKKRRVCSVHTTDCVTRSSFVTHLDGNRCTQNNDCCLARVPYVAKADTLQWKHSCVTHLSDTCWAVLNFVHELPDSGEKPLLFTSTFDRFRAAIDVSERFVEDFHVQQTIHIGLSEILFALDHYTTINSPTVGALCARVWRLIQTAESDVIAFLMEHVAMPMFPTFAERMRAHYVLVDLWTQYKREPDSKCCIVNCKCLSNEPVVGSKTLREQVVISCKK